MRSHQLPVALLAFLGLVAIVPAWVYFTNDYVTLRPEGTILASLVLPSTILLFLTSWIKPELTKPVLGLFVLIGIMVLAPWFFQFIDMVSGQLTDDPLAQLLIQLVVPLVILAFVAKLGFQRVRRAG